MNNTKGQGTTDEAVAGGLQRSVYQDPQDIKKSRNRLAQRKHRARAKKPQSQSINQDGVGVVAGGAGCGGGNGAGGGGGETLDSYHQASSTGTRRQDFEPDIDPAIDTMDFTIPSADESGGLQNAKSTSIDDAELKQFMMTPISNIPSYEGPSSTGYFPPENMRGNQYPGLFPPRFLPQTQNNGTPEVHDFTSLHEASQRQHQYQQFQMHLQMQGAQQVPPNTRSDADILSSPTHMRHTRAQSLTTANVGKISQLDISARGPSVHNTGQGSVQVGKNDIKITNDNDKADCTGSDSDTSSGTSSSGSSRQASPGTSPPTTLSSKDVEDRCEGLLKAITESGFESFDDAATQYYTSSFKEDSLCYLAQERSRRRSLTTFLESLNKNVKQWSERDVQGYKNHLGGVAENWYLDEFSNARRELMKHQRAIVRSRRESHGREESGHVINDSEINERLREKRIRVREKVPEIWSLLFELTQKAGLQQPHGLQAVDAFLLLLLESSSGSR